MVERAEKQKNKADMIIYIDLDGLKFIEKPLLNVKSDLHHPQSKEEIEQLLEKTSKKRHLVVVTFAEAWRSKSTSEQNRIITELEEILKKYFASVVFHQEQRNFYTKILKE